MAGHEIGRGLTFLNGACFAGAALIQSSSGVVIELARGSDPAGTYRLLFLFLAALLAAALLYYARSEDPRLTARPVPEATRLA